MKYMYFIILLLNGLFTLSCEKTPHPAFYSGCCETTPFDQELSVGNVYIPNAFTPNWDGINDLFYIHTGRFSNNDLVIEKFVISSVAGETLFKIYNAEPNETIYGWDGLYKRQKYTGLFHYEAVLSDGRGSRVIINSKACVIRCNTDTNVNIADPQMCTFSLQHDGEGGFDERFNNGENDCF